MSRWQSASLSEVTELIARGIAPNYIDYGGIAVLNQRCVREHGIDFRLARRHDYVMKRVSDERIIRAGDVLINSTGVGTLGRVAQVRANPKERTTVDTHVTIVRPKEKTFYPDFFGYMLVTIENKLAQSGEGASGQTELSRSTIGECEVAYPTDIAEQKRIVAILDETFKGIAKATANAERNLVNVQELFATKLSRMLDPKIRSWLRGPLGKFVTIKHGFAFQSKYFVQEGEYVLLTPGNFFEEGGYRDRGDKQKYYSGPIPNGFTLRSGSLLVAMTEQAPGLLGSPLIVPAERTFLHNQRLGLVEPLPDVPWVPEFFEHLFNTKRFRHKVYQDGTGVKVRHTSPEKLRSIVVQIPPSESEQRQVADTLSELRATCKKIEVAYKRRIGLADELRTSILNRAFSGRLKGDGVVAA